MRAGAVATAVAIAVIALGAMTSTALGASSSGDKAAAKAGVLTLQDFPSGWAPKPRSASSSAEVDKLVSSIPARRQFVPLLANAKTGAEAQSPTSFTDGSVTLDNSVRVYPSVASAERPFNAAKTQAFSACLEPLSKAAVRAGAASTCSSTQSCALLSQLHVSVAAQPANPGVTAGDGQAALDVTATASIGEVTQTVYLEFVVIRVGRALDAFSYQDNNGPITDVMPAVIQAPVSRLEAALGG